jgi:hypothetical protein
MEFDDNSKNRNTSLVIAQLRLLYQVRRLPLELFALIAIGAIVVWAIQKF